MKSTNWNITHAILTTLAYADIFDFPLTPIEITRYCIGGIYTHRAVVKELRYLSGKHVARYQYCVLPNRAHIIRKRRIRIGESRKKWKIVLGISRWLRYIPSIVLVGVTGAVAMDNADRDDDIDLFIVTDKGTLWITRLLVNLIVEVVGNRRHPGEHNIGDSICLNMFVTDDSLAVTSSERDLYTAHEVLQMKPLWERGHVYAAFLEANAWVGHYLPRWWDEKHPLKEQASERPFRIMTWFPLLLLRGIEKTARQLQMAYMAKRRTREVLGDSIIRFHPRDTHAYVREQLSERLKALNIPLDNVFVHSIK